jgi:hypothetical protein
MVCVFVALFPRRGSHGGYSSFVSPFSPSTYDHFALLTTDRMAAKENNGVWANAVGGVVGGVVSRTLTAPADCVRTLMQVGYGTLK